MSLTKEKNEKSEQTNKYFPYKAYPQQKKLMDFLIQSLLKTKNIEEDDENSPKILLIESPTGTGKTMMILSSLLEFLEEKNLKNKNKEKNEIKKITNDKNDEEEEEDWLKNFGENPKEELNGNKIEENKVKKINEKMDFIMINIKKKIKKEENLDKEEEKMIIKNDIGKNNFFLFQKNTSEIVNQIFFCTRTHSQISQIINEEKIIFDYYYKNSSLFNHKKFPFSFTFIGSRKQLCINKKINNNINLLNKINTLCREINDKKETRCAYKKFMYDDLLNENSKNFICEEIKTEIKDIEDLLKFGEDFNICPYYASHIAINSSQFVVSPYNNILNKRIKNNMNINLENNIIVFDESHNIIENILQCANTDINFNELISLLISLFLYYNKYKTKLSPSNNLSVRQIVSIIKIFLSFLTKTKNENNQQNNEEEEYINIKLSDFSIENKLNNYDFFKLINFIDDSELSNKIQWNLQKIINDIKNDKNNEFSKKISNLLQPQIKQYMDNFNDINNNCIKFLNYYLQILISSNPLNKFGLLLIGTLNVDDDGLLLYHKKNKMIKFILLNPTRDFNHLLKEAKCIIFIGGTMKPFDDYYNLFPSIDKKKILTFEGEHIINKGSILPYILSINILCNNEIFTFTYESMKKNSEINFHYLLEYINIYYFLFKEKINKSGMGIVVFFQSYDLISKIIEYNNQKGILKFDINDLFYEKKNEEKEEKYKNVFVLYSDNILVKNKVSVLFGVMGGKLSEGINFKDNLCRLLIIVGMPFANIKSIEIKEKMKYYDKIYNNKKSSVNGTEYYENICMKNINQTIGRCIRNYNDYSAIILIDNRFTYNKYFNKLPKWIIREGKNIIKNKQEFDTHLIKIKDFINMKY